MTPRHGFASAFLLLLPLAAGAAEAVRDGAIDTQTPVLASTQPSVVRLYPPLDRIGDTAADDREVWFGTAGGVKILDRATGKWRFLTSYDGMPRGYSGLLLTPENAYLFGGWDNKYTVLNRATGACREVQLGDTHVRGAWGPPYFSHILHENSLWAIYTGGRVELGPPDIIELRQFDPATGKAGLTVDIRKLLPPPATQPMGAGWEFPVGLTVAGGKLWLGLTHGIVEVNPATGAGRLIELPAAADYANNGFQIRNAIQTIASGESDLWLALQSGLGQFTLATGKFTFHHVGDAKDAPAGLFVERDAVWLAGRRGSIARHDPKTGQLETYNTGLTGLHRLMRVGGRFWLIAGDAGTWYFDLGTKKLVSIVHDALAGYGLMVAGSSLIDKTFYLFAGRRVADGKDFKTEGGLLALDVLTGDVRFTRTDLTWGMRQQDGVLWLLGEGRAAGFDLATGTLGEVKGPGLEGRTLSHPLTLVGASQGKSYYVAETYKRDAADANAMSVLVFEPAAGKMDVLFTVPEAWRQQNAKVEGLAGGYVYLAYVQGERVDKRFSLARSAWEEAPHRPNTGGWTRVAEAHGRQWWSTGRQIQGYAGDDDRLPQAFGFAPEHIEELSAVDGELEARTRHLLLRYDGKTWRARPLDEPGLIRGTDLKGRPTDLAVVGDGRGLVIHRDRAFLAPEWTPLRADADGQLALPPALRKLIPER